MSYCVHENNSKFGLALGENDDDNDESLSRHMKIQKFYCMLSYTCIYKQNKCVKSRRKQLKEFILSSSKIKAFELLITHSKKRFECINQTSSVISFSKRQCFHCYYLVQVAVKNIRFVKFQIFLTVFKA